MLTRAQIRRLILELLVIVFASVILIVTGVFLSMDKEEIRVQKNYKAKFYDIMPATTYEEISYDHVGKPEGINHVYVAYDELNAIIGYVADVSVTDASDKQLHSLFGVSADGLSIVSYKRVGDETEPLEFYDTELDDLANQIVNKPLPVAIANSENEVIVIKSDYDPPAGLIDGTYYAQTMSLDSKGYIDYVEIVIENGRIKRVQWDGLNIDPTTGSRNHSSLTGAYVISGKNWATQAYNICHALIELQDVSRLAMKSDGTTEIIPDVTCNISVFVDLAEECLENSKVGFTKDDYIAALSELITKDGGVISEIMTEDGFMVYPFNDLSVFDRDGSGSSIDRLTVYETTLTNEELDEFEVVIGEDAIATPVPTSAPDDQDFGAGAEDGIVADGTQSIITDSLDGIPLSLFETFIPGIPDGNKRALTFVSSVNITYKFFVDYMNWIA